MANRYDRKRKRSKKESKKEIRKYTYKMCELPEIVSCCVYVVEINTNEIFVYFKICDDCLDLEMGICKGSKVPLECFKSG